VKLFAEMGNVGGAYRKAHRRRSWLRLKQPCCHVDLK
jgi:hypothetical protein